MRYLSKFSVVLVIILMTSMSLAASHGPFGLGLMLGAPTGLSGNYLLSNTRSIDAALAFDLTDDSNFVLHSTYLFRYPKSLHIDGAALGWFWGVGGRYRSHDDDNPFEDEGDFRIGVRGAIGLNYESQQYPLEFFGEISATVNLLPKTDGDFGISIGAHYYF